MVNIPLRNSFFLQYGEFLLQFKMSTADIKSSFSYLICEFTTIGTEIRIGKALKVLEIVRIHGNYVMV